MSLALESLIFEVDSKQLESALGSINKLATAVSNFNREQDKETRQAIQAEKVKQEQAKTEKELAKAKEASVKATQASERAIAKEAKAVQDSTTGVSKLDKLIANLGNTYSDLSNGMTRGESSILNTARNLGATATQLDKVNKSLKDIGTLTKNPFDASLGAIRSISKELENMQHRVDLATKGIVLSTKQLGEYSRISDEIAAKMKTAGQDISSASGIVEFNKRVKDAQSQYLGMATQVQAFSQVEKDAARVHRENANAVRALAIEEEKVTSIIKSMNAEVGHQSALSEKTAISIAKYERNLKLAGVSAGEATQKLAVYKAQLKEIQLVEEKRKIDYLSRSLTPQISDVAVSLYGGMNPFTVLMQQGLQVRDLISQSGVEAEKLHQAFRTAASDMVGSIKGTALALGSLLIGSIQDAGKAVVNSLVNPFVMGMKAIKDSFRPEDLNFDLGPQISRNTLNIRNLTESFISLSRVIAVGAVAAIGVLAIAGMQVMKAMSEMNSQLIQFGASLGLTASHAKELAVTLNETTGGTFADSLEAVGKFAKSGIADFGQLSEAVKVAIELQKNLGIEVEETVKKYSAVAKDPVDGLIELAKNTGTVTEAQIRHIYQLEKTVGKAKAVEEAIKLVTAANVDMAQRSRESLSDAEKLWIDIKNAVSSAWGEIQLVASNMNLMKGVRDLFAKIKLVIQQAFTVAEAFIRVIEKIVTLDFDSKFSGELNKYIDDKIAGNYKEYETTIADVYNTSVKTAAVLEAEAKARQKNAIAANGLKEVLKEEEKASKAASAENEKLANSYLKVLERFSDLQIQINKAKTGDENKSVWETTKAYGLLQDVMNDPSWKKFDDNRKNAILTKYANIAALEVETLELVKQKKALEALDKMYQDFNKDRLKGTADIEETSKELDFQYSILNKSEKEIRAMTIAYEEQKNTARILTEYELKRLDIMQKYAAAASGLTGAELETQAKILIANLSELATEEEKKLFLERQKSNLKVVQDYEKRWSRIQDSLSEILYNSLFKGGKTAAEDIRKLIEDELKKEFIIPAIKVFINYVTGGVGTMLGSAGNSVLNTVLGTSGANGGAGTNYLGIANNASTLNNMYGAASQYLTGSSLGASSASLLYANGVGMMGGDSLGALIAANGSWAGVEAGGAAASAAASESAWGSMFGEAAAGAWVLAVPAIASAIKTFGTRKAYEFDGLAIKGDYAANNFNGAAATKWEADGGWWENADAKKVWTKLSSDPAVLLSQIFPNGTSGLTLPSDLGNIGKKPSSVKIDASAEMAAYEAGRNAVPFESRYSDSFMDPNGGVVYRPSNDGLSVTGDMTKRGEIGSTTPRFSTDPVVLGALDSAIDAIFKATQASFKGLATKFEDADLSSQIDAFTTSINIDTSSSNMSKVLGELADTVNNQMAQAFLPSIETLRLPEEAWQTAFNRVMVEVAGTSRVLDLMGVSIKEAFGTTATNDILKAVGGLNKLFGGVDNLNSAFGAYYANFYTQEEQIAQGMKEMGKAFASMNLSMPTTREGFRALVDGLDLSTIGGQATFKALMDLQGAFASLVPAISETTDALQKAQAAQLSKNQETQANQISKYLEYVRKQQQDLINEQVDASKGIADAARATADTFRNILKSLEEYRRSLLQSASSTLNPNQKYAEAKLSYESTTAKAKAGDVDSINNIKAVSDAFLAASMDVSSIAGYNTDFSSVLATIDSISASATGKISNSEQQLIIANQQLLTLQQIRDSLAATNSAPLVVSNIQQAVKDWDDWFKNTKVGDIVKYDVGTTQRLSESMGMLVDNMGKAFTFNKDDSPYQLANESTAWYEEMISRYGKWNMPSFDVGTNYVPNDMIANIHKGERIIPAADNASLMTALSGNNCIDNSEMIIELRALRSEVASLRSERTSDAVVIARNTRVTSQILEKFDINGMPPERVD